MRVQALAMAVALGAGALCVPAPEAVAQTSSPRATGSAQQNGKVLVIPAQPTVRTRVSQWLSSWRANGGEVKGEAAQVRTAAEAGQPKAKKPRRTASKKTTRTARKSNQQQVAGRPAKASQRPAKPPGEEAPAAAASEPVTATAPAATNPAPPQTSVQVAPAYAAPPEVRRVPPSQSLSTPLADIPPVTLFVPPAMAGALAAAPADGAAATVPPVVAALPSPAVTPEPKPAAPEPPLPPATSRVHKQPDPTDEATWWRTEGEPAIVNFRDCIAAYAGRESQRRPATSLGDLVIEAGAGDCRAPFEDMMTTLTVRYGRERLESAMGAILNETLLPAARAAADEAARTAAGTPPAP